MKVFSQARVSRRLLASSFGVVVMMASVLAVGVSTTAALGQSGPRVVVIVMENQPYTNIIGNKRAPYINSLTAKGELFTNYSEVTSGSLHDYLAMTSGLTSLLSPPQSNIFQAIDASSGADTWISFQESMGGNCGKTSSATVPGTSVPLYTRGHDPAYQYHGNESCSQHDIPMTAASFIPAALPSFSFITPNQCDDMHTVAHGQPCPAYYGANKASSAIGVGDNWLSVVVPKLLAQPNVTVVLTWDEGNSTSKHIVTLEVGAGIKPASSDAQAYNHYSLEAGLYSSLGLGTAPHNGSTATPLPIP